jgi:hypothetical protein
MGQTLSGITNLQTRQIPVNYNCHICQESGKVPNILGRFFNIDSDNIRCNGCNTIFTKVTVDETVVACVIDT